MDGFGPCFLQSKISVSDLIPLIYVCEKLQHFTVTIAAWLAKPLPSQKEEEDKETVQ